MKCFSTVFVENTFFITFRHPVFRVTRFPFPCWAGFHLFWRCFVMRFPLVTRIFPTKRVIKTEFGKRNRKCKKEAKKNTVKVIVMQPKKIGMPIQKLNKYIKRIYVCIVRNKTEFNSTQLRTQKTKKKYCRFVYLPT